MHLPLRSWIAILRQTISRFGPWGWLRAEYACDGQLSEQSDYEILFRHVEKGAGASLPVCDSPGNTEPYFSLQRRILNRTGRHAAIDYLKPDQFEQAGDGWFTEGISRVPDCEDRSSKQKPAGKAGKRPRQTCNARSRPDVMDAGLLSALEPFQRVHSASVDGKRGKMSTFQPIGSNQAERAGGVFYESISVREEPISSTG